MKHLKLFEGFWGSEASGILPIAKDTGKILLGLRSGAVLEPYTWGNFGGAIGLDDYGLDEEKLSPEDNALKELEEEIGLNINFNLIPSYIFEKSNFKYYNFLGLIDTESQISKDNTTLGWEVDDIKWFTMEEVLNMKDLHFGIKTLLDNNIDQIKKYTK